MEVDKKDINKEELKVGIYITRTRKGFSVFDMSYTDGDRFCCISAKRYFYCEKKMKAHLVRLTGELKSKNVPCTVHA